MIKTQNKAFTLVELIVVVTILAILATIGFVSYSSYLIGVRDTNRIAQMTSLSDGLNLYSTTNDLPIPEDNVEIRVGTDVIAYQGYAGANILETINFDKGGLDPKDNTYFSYYLTKDRKYFQMMGFLEESVDLTTQNIVSNQASAVRYVDRIPTVTGKKLGILTDVDNIPVQDIGTSIDISSTSDIYKAFLTNDDILEGDNTELAILENVLKKGGRGYSIENDIVVYIDPDSGIPRDGLVAEYLFEDNFYDYSGYENHGTRPNPIFVDGKIGRAFDANSGTVIIPDSESLDISTNEFTLSSWVKMDVSLSAMNSAYPIIMIKRPWLEGGYILYFSQPTDMIGAQYCSNGGNHGDVYPTFSPGEYYHVTGVYDGTKVTLYINGKQVIEQNSTAPMGSSAGTDLNIGNAFQGEIDNVRIYDRALNQNEINALYSEGD